MADGIVYHIFGFFAYAAAQVAVIALFMFRSLEVAGLAGAIAICIFGIANPFAKRYPAKEPNYRRMFYGTVSVIIVFVLLALATDLFN